VIIKIFSTPSKYVQGLGASNEIGKHVKDLGKKALIMGGPTSVSLVENAVKKSFEENKVAIVGIDKTVKECTHEAINRLSQEGRSKGADVIVGVGGGKAVDTAKGVALLSSLSIRPTTKAMNPPKE
jgi:glycerol dehydrogenase